MNSVTGLSLGRIAVGALAVARPDLAGRAFQLDVARNPQLPYVARLFGSREIALGVVTLLARGSSRRNLTLVGIAVDAADAGTGCLGIQEKQVTPTAGAALVAPAIGAVLAGLAGLRGARASRRADERAAAAA